MVRSFAQGLMPAEADVICGAPWGQQSPDVEEIPRRCPLAGVRLGPSQKTDVAIWNRQAVQAEAGVS